MSFLERLRRSETQGKNLREQQKRDSIAKALAQAERKKVERVEKKRA
jgi:hypothetical protein